MTLMAVLAVASGLCCADNVPQEGMLDIYSGDKIVTVGDSITTDAFKWWDQYQGSVDLWYTSRGLTPPTWVNKGIGGAYTTTIAMPAVIAEVIAEAPDIVLNNIGTNDPRTNPEATSITQYNSWWDQLLAAVPGVKVMMLTPPFNNEEPQFPASTWNSLAAAWRQIARERGAVCVDLRSYYNNTLSAAEQAALSSDGTHPTNPGGRAWWSARALFQTRLNAGARP